jgi:protein-S-isoprenylcysteine O-methyltransferase Ste14
MSPTLHLTLLAAGWTLYGLIHSLLASHCCKAWPPLILLFSYPGSPLWHWPGALGWVADGAALAAIAGFIATFRIYDTSEFLGTRQLRNRSAALDDQAPMSVSWAHRFVRHPWYFLGLVVIWTREMNAALLTTAVILTLYVIAGSRLEERKLDDLYGERYRAYRQRVPALLPLPWRYLSRRETALINRSGKSVDEPAGDPDDTGT